MLIGTQGIRDSMQAVEDMGQIDGEEKQWEQEGTSRRECDRASAEPAVGSIQEHFDGLRANGKLLSEASGGLGNASLCTRKDVCLLMRQLDMDFFARARKGTLTDADYDNPPSVSWVETGNCQTAARGYRMVPVLDTTRCKQHIEGATLIPINDAALPQGCVKHKGKFYMNEATSNAIAGTQAESKSNTLNVMTYTSQLCEMDRSLTESAAFYYSPYKLKEGMPPARSTSCSFGMMAYLSKLGETKSSCATILTYKAHPDFPSAQTAIERADALAKSGKTEAAKAVQAYVESIRQKSVLIDTISNHWCPDTWTKAQKSGNTCDVQRLTTWTEEFQSANAPDAAPSAPAMAGRATHKKAATGRMSQAVQAGRASVLPGNADLVQRVRKALLANAAEEDKRETVSGLQALRHAPPGASKPSKLALMESACDAFEDETLQSILDRTGAPPKWYYEIPEDAADVS